jgi:hypothetical protein
VFQLTVPAEPGLSPVIVPLDPGAIAQFVMPDRVADKLDGIPELVWPASPGSEHSSALFPQPLPRGLPRFLGGRLILKLLGHGPLGCALLARPLFLGDSEVVKLLPADRAGDRVYAAEFAREAFAASQLEHPNLVAIRELGSERGQPYVAVERVCGPSLADLVQEPKQLDAYEAAVLILQAARGLHAAHEQSLWHRDVKPANLRLDPAGLVRVDDVGLEMTPSMAAAIAAKEKQKSPPVQVAVGSPAFMAPEQASDPVSSDGRADIYALGGTFYNLVTGRPPFAGDNAVELLRKHREEAVIPAREFVPELPRAISDVITAMMGKRLDERYPSMAVVVDVLEGLLGVQAGNATAELEKAGEAIRQAALTLGELPARGLRFRVLALSLSIWLGMVLLLLGLGLWGPAVGMLGFGAVTIAVLLVISGFTHGSDLLRLASRVILGGRVRPWLILLTAAAILAALWAWGGSMPWFPLVCVGGLVGAFHFFLDRPLARERRAIVDATKARLRDLRARGHAEDALRALFARHGGKHWEDLFETVFGHRALVTARARWGRDSAAKRKRLLGSCRDGLFSLLEKRLEARSDLLATRLLESVEEGRLEEAGVNLLTARRRARRIAKAMVLTAAQWRDEQRLLASGRDSTVALGPPLLHRLHRAASQPEAALEPHEPQSSPLLRRVDSLSSFLLGRGIRFLMGAGLFILFAVWLDASGIVTVTQVRDQAREIDRVIRRAMQSADAAILRELRWGISWDWQRLQDPIAILLFPVSQKTAIVGANLGVAALILILSLFSGRKITGFLALLASALTLFGPLWGVVIPALTDRLDASAQARCLGALFLIAGFLWPRRRSA